MPRKKMDGVRIHVMITTPQNKKMEQMSRKTGLAMSELLRRAIDAFLNEPKETE